MAAKAPKDKRPFPSIAYELVNDPSLQEYISWSPTNDSFIIWKPEDFAAAWKKSFKHNNIQSFIRQLNLYGFHKAEKELRPPAIAFKHENFVRNRPDLLPLICRRTKTPKKESSNGIPSTPIPSTPQALNLSTSPQNLKQEADNDDRQLNGAPLLSDISLPETSLIQGLSKQNAELKGLNDILIEEILRLRTQQKRTDDTLVQVMEQLQRTVSDHNLLKNQFQDFIHVAATSPTHATSQTINSQLQNNQALVSETLYYLSDLGLEDFAKFHLSEELTHQMQRSTPPSPFTPNISGAFSPTSPVSAFLTPPASPFHAVNYSYPSSPGNPLSPAVFSYEYHPGEGQQDDKEDED
eukprot:TRINITY_DN5611_c0_g2_i1.p2 TRINITY_DN5611_c0_g2~~TRINITY_DN5611_c0_g2_i1.p2  ORF type:complete len:352 (-),score=96.96 TRINITY_DN5611_c0_g2_i1:1267-2322(-)